ncbi:ORF6N domain-containing protein [Cronobacter sp. EKM101R]|uniref:ORF6N domain-containing protein n=2 Tax=Enterobacteriaceae TaxID=543 RepID=UPI0013EBC571|nr:MULTISPECIES: ORF6N domain-containing protein [Cronobacter]KAF6589144.1 ORF6N domain-containing protein [Cronobacter sp. EKM101R]KAF6592398.1 ORF6N domain-containing protein [Cronobacter sp. EKM102R]MDK1186575.1 ORF6N domain-containing protein [Cronobacter turicensis]MDK1208238.1 ORF6N domain-containing protein [Cronobacter turicensis]MDK1216579.1 ORF6N domain-containing protein [Cronobacter turicensis]
MMETLSVESLTVVTHCNIPVITTELLARLYKTEGKHIRQNFKRNECRFISGKHFFKVSGFELDDLRTSQRGLQISPKVRSLILWTERGAARHAKMLETDQAWEVFEKLEDCYFRQNGFETTPPEAQPIPSQHAIITYFENGLPVSSMPLMPGQIVMNPEQCFEHMMCAGFLIIPCDEAGSLTLDDLQGMIEVARKTRDDWLRGKQISLR